MRRISISLLFFLAVAANAASTTEQPSPRQSVTLDFLLESCANVGGTARGMIPYFDCDSYIYGVLDTYLRDRQFIPRDRQACFPETLTPSQVLNDAWHLENKFGSKNAAAVLIDVLSKKYPCG